MVSSLHSFQSFILLLRQSLKHEYICTPIYFTTGDYDIVLRPVSWRISYEPILCFRSAAFLFTPRFREYPPTLCSHYFCLFDSYPCPRPHKHTFGYQAYLTPSISPAEVENRKLVEQEENKIIQEEHKSIRRDSVSFLKRRTSERKTNLATPTLTITTESFRISPLLSPAISPTRSPTPPDSAVTSLELAAPILGSSSTASMNISPDTLQSEREQTVLARDTPMTSYAGPFGIRSLVLTPIEQESAISQDQADEHATKAVTPSPIGPATSVYPPRISSMAPPPPTAVAGWVRDGYTSNYGTTPTSAAQTMRVDPWQKKATSLTAPHFIPSSSRPDTRKFSR